MNEFIDWFQNNWIDLARLSVQIAILAMLVRYGRKLLATLRASQEQVGALLRLSVSDAVQERPAAATTPEPARRFEPAPAAFSEPEPEPEPEPVFAGVSSRSSYEDEREHTLGGRVIGSPSRAFSTPTPAPSFSSPASRAESPAYTPWVSAPGTAQEGFALPTSAALPEPPRASTWVQPPAPARRSGVGPWRKMVRWLQAPVRS
jgi:hypothetical protein